MKRFLVAGLGNPGSEYLNTRHNIGFQVLDFLAGKSGISFSSQRYGDVAEWRLKGRQILLLKPNTFMNLSGKAVRFYLQTNKIESADLLVVTDELALDFGRMRLRPKGSDGGHNGMKSLIQELGNDRFPRLRMGIGNQFPKGRQVDYVLGNWGPEEQSQLNDWLLKSSMCIESFVLEGIGIAMNKYNS